MKNKIYRETVDFKDFNKVKKKIKLNTLYNSYQKKTLKYYVGLAKLKKHSKALELGCQFALFNNIFRNYIGIDINPKLIKFARKLHKKINLKVASATKLPFKKEIDFLFSFATIEHIKRPDLVFREIDRVLNKGGTLLLAPAWNCRKYIVQKLEHRDYKDLSITLKLSKFFIPLQNNLLLRGMIRLPVRIYDELLYLLKKKIKFRYTRLYPSYNLWGKYPSQADDDAVVNMDAHSAIMYFISRGYVCITHNNLLKRLICRGSPVVLKKI